MRFRLMLAAPSFALLLLAMPLHAQPVPVAGVPQSQQMDESVQEPDEGDLEQVLPPEPEPKPVKEKKKEKSKGEKSAEKPADKSPEISGEDNFNEVMLQGLNKVTARASAIEAPIGSVVRFGTIEIVAHSCWKSAPDERPENAALLEISEIKQGEPPTRIFLGWMFSSSPGLSSLEHPFYDVTVVECKQGKV
jgi:hypothetical protein